MSLRDELIEAGAKAFNGTYRDLDTGEQVQSPWEGDLADMERALDAILDKLTEQRTDEVWVADTSDVFQQEVWLGQEPRQVLIADLAALRVQPGETQ